ncbi:MAG: hypothetical protein J6J86_08680 [Lachnospiraceae bacterium]|nr:hypothetical protein [Lachnospiraceae bacterium]
MYTYKISNDIPLYLLDMPLVEMRCKHVFNIGMKEITVLKESKRIGYEWCEWGSHSGHERNFGYHSEVIRRMEREEYCHAVSVGKLDDGRCYKRGYEEPEG